MQRFWAWAEQGAVNVEINNQASDEYFQESYPSCTVTVYDEGTSDLSTLYSDDAVTPLANPFTAQSNGYFWFYAADGRYDVVLSGGGLASPLTLSDILLFDSGSDLIAAIAALASNGLITRTSSSTASARTITAGSANISITNGNGVSGNPTIDLGTTLTGRTINGSSNTLTVLAATQLSGAVPLANGGTAAVLSDPGADRIMFWDDSGGAVDWLTVGTGLSISGTTLTCTITGTVGGSGTTNTLPKFSASTTLADSGITDDGTTIKNARNTRITSGSLSVNGDFAAQAQIHVKTTANASVWEETDAGTNEKPWLWSMAAGILSLSTLTDAYAAGSAIFSIDRSAATPLYMAMNTRFELDKGADVASGGDLTLGTDGNVFHITGTTTINAIITANWQAGSIVTFIFDASVTVKNNTAGGAGTAVMHLAAAGDLSATANDTLTLVYDGTAWYEVCRSVN